MQIFRSHPASSPSPALHQEAARFFSTNQMTLVQHVPESFDLSSLRNNLPQQPLLQSSPSPWAGDFLDQSTVHPNALNPPSELTNNSPMGIRQYPLPRNDTFMSGI